MAIQGNWGASLAWLGLLLVITVVVLYLWQLVLERSLSSPEVSGSARVRNRRRQQAVPLAVSPAARPGSANAQLAGVSIWWLIVSPQVSAIALKDLKYYWRDPQLKARMLPALIYVIIFLVGPLLNPDSSRFGGSAFTLVIVPLLVFLFLATLSLNTLGLERDSLTTLFLFPVPPRRILWGKNLAVFALGIVEFLILIAVGVFLSHAWNLVLPVLFVGLAGMGVTSVCPNFSSASFPQYDHPMQRGFRPTGQTSPSWCLPAVFSLVMLAATAVLLVPVVLALALPYFLRAEWIWGITIPLSLVYGIAFHQVVTLLVAPRILKRAPEILAVTTRD